MFQNTTLTQDYFRNQRTRVSKLVCCQKSDKNACGCHNLVSWVPDYTHKREKTRVALPPHPFPFHHQHLINFIDLCLLLSLLYSYCHVLGL